MAIENPKRRLTITEKNRDLLMDRGTAASKARVAAINTSLLILPLSIQKKITKGATKLKKQIIKEVYNINMKRFIRNQEIINYKIYKSCFAFSCDYKKHSLID